MLNTSRLFEDIISQETKNSPEYKMSEYPYKKSYYNKKRNEFESIDLGMSPEEEAEKKRKADELNKEIEEWKADIKKCKKELIDDNQDYWEKHQFPTIPEDQEFVPLEDSEWWTQYSQDPKDHTVWIENPDFDEDAYSKWVDLNNNCDRYERIMNTARRFAKADAEFYLKREPTKAEIEEQLKKGPDAANYKKYLEYNDELKKFKKEYKNKMKYLLRYTRTSLADARAKGLHYWKHNPKDYLSHVDV